MLKLYCAYSISFPYTLSVRIQFSLSDYFFILINFYSFYRRTPPSLVLYVRYSVFLGGEREIVSSTKNRKKRKKKTQQFFPSIYHSRDDLGLVVCFCDCVNFFCVSQKTFQAKNVENYYSAKRIQPTTIQFCYSCSNIKSGVNFLSNGKKIKKNFFFKKRKVKVVVKGSSIFILFICLFRTS